MATRGFPFGRPVRVIGHTTSKEKLAEVVRDELEEMGYFPTYITPDIKRRIQELQEEELELRKRKAFTLEKGVEMLKEIDDINKDLERVEREATIAAAEARKKKSHKPKPKRKIVKKSRK